MLIDKRVIVHNNTGRLYITNQEIDFSFFLWCVLGGGGGGGVIYNKLLLSHLWSCVLKLVSELHDFISAGIVFHRDAPENEKLVLKRSILLVWAEL